MNPDVQKITCEIFLGLILSIVPFLLSFYVTSPIKSNGKLMRVSFAIVTSWIAAMVFNETLYFGVRLKSASYNGNSDYDGIAINVVIMFFGWIIPFIFALIAVSIEFGIQCSKRSVKGV